MRCLTLAILSMAIAGAAAAQQVGIIGPRLTPADVQADKFDAVFDVKVTLVPAVTLLRNQTDDARYDAIVCNTDKIKQGAVQVNSKAGLGYLDPGVCTMFVNFKDMYLGPIQGDYAWTAKVYLRARR